MSDLEESGCTKGAHVWHNTSEKTKCLNKSQSNKNVFKISYWLKNISLPSYISTEKKY